MRPVKSGSTNAALTRLCRHAEPHLNGNVSPLGSCRALIVPPAGEGGEIGFAGLGLHSRSNAESAGAAQTVVEGDSFTGNLAGGNRTGSLAGSFFSAPGDAAKYQAESFAISGNGPSYKATGVFAGQR
jgi:hypothetical protein